MDYSSFDDIKINRRDLGGIEDIKELKIAVPHMRIVPRSKRDNINRVIELIKESKKDHDPHIFLIPSWFIAGPIIEYPGINQNTLRKFAEKIPGPLVSILIDIARKNSIYLLTGSLLERAGPRLYISSLFISPFKEEGVVFKYRKLNLTNNENIYIAPGKDLGIFDFDTIRLGVLLEEDIYAPEIPRILALSDTDLIVSFNKLSKSFVNIRHIVMTRAIENKTLLINVGGILELSNKEVIDIKTMIVKGDGEIVGESKDSSEEEIFYASLKIRSSKKRSRKTEVDLLKRIISYARKKRIIS
ncbi:MAG: carbon-nitrogen hydrolase family protein [Sulfolobales archaeon]